PLLPDASGGTLTMADLQGNGECGLYLGNNAANTFVGLLVQENGTYGVFSSALSQSNFFYGGDYEVNGRPDTHDDTTYYDFYIEAGSKSNKLIGGSCYNFPQSFRCDEPENTILDWKDTGYAGSGQYAGLHLQNKESSVPTVLDWYSEGTFTPAVAGSTSAGTADYSVQQGTYTRIGNVVTFALTVAYTGHTGTGKMTVTGLPFQATGDFTPV